MADYGIVPATGAYGTSWPGHFVLPQGKNGAISMGGWTSGNEGFVQQTLFGASIRTFDVNAGFGDSTSSVSVRLVNDEFNKSDGTGYGQGDDPYHNGQFDEFRPPVVGSPAFFKFGKNPATIEQAWRKTFDDLYLNGSGTLDPIRFPEYDTQGEITSIPDHHFLVWSSGGTNHWVDKSSLWDLNNRNRGYAHFVFGGILQTYTQTKGGDGNPVYNLTIQDPREILSNCELILKNYAGTTFRNKNLFNLYGFLEYDVSDALQQEIQDLRPSGNNLVKIVNSGTGEVFYRGNDMFVFPSTYSPTTTSSFPSEFPMTGQGFARISEQGIPWYRVSQALTALFEYNGPMPQEYRDKAFGGAIDFRGYKYVVDFSGIPLDLIPRMYFLDFDKIDMLSLAQELCDTISHDLYVSLLPVINHPSCQWLYNYNQDRIRNQDYSNIITGIIRVDAIDRTKQPQYGAIKTYLDNLRLQGIYVENQDVGYEVSNVVTDRFIVGAQETEMYYFHNNRDRDNLELRKFKNGQKNFYEFLQSEQWSLQTSLKQQILPFYGFLGKDAVTIPRGFGAYQQIMLDASHLDAYGVGNYYIATEMELRAAHVSYEVWKNFLVTYNERYMDEVSEDQLIRSAIATQLEPGQFVAGVNDDQMLGKEFAVSVPRCVFNSDQPFMGPDGYPANPCSPPYGYPLYFKRAEKIGIPEAGLTDIVAQQTRIFTNYQTAVQGLEYSEANFNRDSILMATYKKELEQYKKDGNVEGEKELTTSITNLQNKINDAKAQIDAYKASTGDLSITYLEQTLEANKHLSRTIDRLALQSEKNAHKVYAFVKEVADKHLGRTFMVKIPTRCNLSYNKNIFADQNTQEILSGPFGFKPQPISAAFGYAASSGFFQGPEMNSFVQSYNQYRQNLPFENYLESDTNLDLAGQIVASSQYPRYTYGALKNNFNPITEQWEFNYTPDTQGGFFNFALFNSNLSLAEATALNPNQLPLATQQQLTPMNLTNFVESNGRIKCYARFNNSQYLDLAGIGKDSFSQQIVGLGGYIPDIMEEINNTSQDQLTSFNAIQDRLQNQDDRQKAIAFVKCELNPQIYLAPRVISQSGTLVYAREVRPVTQNSAMSLVKKVDPSGCVTHVPAQKYPVVHFIPATSGGADGTVVTNTDFQRKYDPFTNTHIVASEIYELDKDNAYVIVTLPARIQPSIDSRYLDSVYQAHNTVQIKHLLTQDVVKGVAGFDQPAYAANYKTVLNSGCTIDLSSINPAQWVNGNVPTLQLSFKALTDAAMYAKQAQRGLGLALPETYVSFMSPSPVYPDMIAVPLMSHERCYGPWLSSQVPNNPLNEADAHNPRYANIGGKVEFIKDETLAPWNYAGYQLMNEAGSLKAQFSNSLMLFVERGGFVMTEAPTGIALARELKDLGPLVTSINVEVTNSIKTTVKMDLYTSRFGKLQKQKEIAIGQAVRERQRIIDQRNNQIRTGLKSIANGTTNFSELYGRFDPIRSVNDKFDESFSKFEKKTTVYDRLVASVKTQQDTLISLDDPTKKVLDNSQAVHMSVQSEEFQKEIKQNFADRMAYDQEQYYSVEKTWDEIAIPYTEDFHHGSNKGGLPYRIYSNEDAQEDLGTT